MIRFYFIKITLSKVAFFDIYLQMNRKCNMRAHIAKVTCYKLLFLLFFGKLLLTTYNMLAKNTHEKTARLCRFTARNGQLTSAKR